MAQKERLYQALTKHSVMKLLSALPAKRRYNVKVTKWETGMVIEIRTTKDMEYELKDIMQESRELFRPEWDNEDRGEE